MFRHSGFHTRMKISVCCVATSAQIIIFLECLYKPNYFLQIMNHYKFLMICMLKRRLIFWCSYLYAFLNKELCFLIQDTIFETYFFYHQYRPVTIFTLSIYEYSYILNNRKFIESFFAGHY